MDFIGVNFKVYFVGVGGAGMSALCKLLSRKGVKVYGSDIVKSSVVIDLIENYSLNFYLGHDGNLLDGCDIVVYSSAINENNLEIVRAKYLKKPLFSRAELLSMIVNSYTVSVGVAGSHGKTTATSMLAYILNCANVNSTALIGGEDVAFQGFNYNGDNALVFEACEFNGNLKRLSPTVSAVLNIDNDHLDYYKDIKNLKREFFSYLDRADYKVISLNDGNLCDYKSSNIITYAIGKNADYVAKNLVSNNGAYSFEAFEKNKKLGVVSLSVLGAHNVHNALLAIAVAREIFGLDFSVISSALNGFLGVKRRFESLGEKNGINFVADYAHHPKEIEKALELADEIWGSDYAIIFQPHTYSRTEILFTDFLNVFSGRSPLVFKTYAAREKYTFLGSAERLSLKLDNSWYFEDFSELTFFIDNNVKVKNVLVLGAGDLYENIKNYVKTADK